MTHDNTDGRVRRGYMILVGIAIVAALIFNINAVKDLAGDRTDLVALLPDAAGIRVGAPVRVAGVESGRVTGIDFVQAGDSATVALHLRIEGESTRVIRADSEVRALRLRFIGQPVIQIEAGSAAAPAIRSGDTLFGSGSPDPLALLESGKDLPRALDSLMTAARQVAALSRARQPDLARLQAQLDGVLSAGRALSADLEGGSLGPMMAEGGLGAVSRLQARLGQLRLAVDAARARYIGNDAEGGSELTRALDSLKARVAAVTSELDALNERAAATGGGTLDRMARDSAIQVAIGRLQAQLDTLRQEGASIALRMFLP